MNFLNDASFRDSSVAVIVVFSRRQNHRLEFFGDDSVSIIAYELYCISVSVLLVVFCCVIFL